MKKLIIVTTALLAVACGETKTVYVTETDAPVVTDAPETTAKPAPTTEAPIAISPTENLETKFIIGVSAIYDAPIFVSDADMIETGWLVCQALDSGSTAEEIAYAMITSAPGDTRTQEFLSAVVASAVYNFCPQYQWMFL